ncbi:MAG: adenylate/guanylate cyclase domain-containing protein [Pyrinomonadaceae bacterium]|nr:adenylate/guanylate cyclase domain-containing protein [Pyrinomonadaceae bacterium]
MNAQQKIIDRLREYLLVPGEPDARLKPKWLARRLDVPERQLLGALAHCVRDGLVEMHWEVYCPVCGRSPGEFGTLKEAHSKVECTACESCFDLHLDRDVRVTFSATESIRRLRGSGGVPQALEGDSEAQTRGLDLLLIPSFWELFSGEAPADDESLHIGRVTILFTDLRGSTAMYQERGDPRAYHMVREHFAILGRCIDRNHGSLVKTIGDAVMASFASGAEAVRAAHDAQAELHAQAQSMGAELVLKAGVHSGACLAVRLNDRLDFFGGAVNTAARVQGLSLGNDVVVTDTVLADIEAERIENKPRVRVIESFNAQLRGINAPVRVHRLIEVEAETAPQHYLRRLACQTEAIS